MIDMLRIDLRQPSNALMNLFDEIVAKSASEANIGFVMMQAPTVSPFNNQRFLHRALPRDQDACAAVLRKRRIASVKNSAPIPAVSRNSRHTTFSPAPR